MIIEKTQIDKIEEIEKAQNNGLGICCVKDIISFLRKGEIEYAQRIFSIDGDKIERYPELYILLISILGCRTHGKIGCTNWLCRTIYDQVSRQMALQQLDKKESRDDG